MENPTERIAEFIASTTFDQISEDSIKIAKMQIADYSGVAIAGSLEDESRIIRDVVLEKTRNHAGPCTVFGTSFQAHPDDAALINGVQAHVLDYDDVSQTMYGQPGIIFKKYPSCAFTHPAIDATLEIYEEPTPPPTEICEIKVGINKMASDALNYQGASNGLEGKFSVEYCVASALLRGGCRLADFTTKT